MLTLNPIEWLALQRTSFSKPRLTWKKIKEGSFSKRNLDLIQGKKDWELLQKLGLQMTSFESEAYPKILKEIYDPPLVLLSKGKWPVWEEKPWVAVVGARKATEFGRKKTQEIVTRLVEEGVGIVSGLAYGIDAEAHRACLKAKGNTWGVFGCGVDIIYPRPHRALAEEMTQHGGYLSEFPLGTGPRPAYFPQRNRIISGLVQAVVIVQAHLRSGSLITARFALEQGRDVYVVPPPDNSIAYEGNKMLLDDGAIAWEDQKPKIKNQKLETTESLLIPFLKKPVSIEVLVHQTQKSPGALLAELVQLETEGLVKKIPGSLWQSL
ncbi:MAG: DNA-protecting protein DprA [Deltaproteobacteria bacterium]|nr:DNA-protecting protein DprA [Deltaproteobacteria bacterium]